jgi:hypothetical protein
MYLNQLLTYRLEFAKDSATIPPNLKNELNMGLKRMNAMKNGLMVMVGSEMWDKVKSDISADRLHDLSILLDIVGPMENIGELVEVLKETPKVIVN